MMNRIDYPRKHSKAEIQALLWYFLRKDEIDARLQVTGADGHVIRRIGDSIGKKWCKLDMVIFKDKIPKCIVECKSWSDGYSKTAIYRTNNTKQIEKYKELYSLPVLICARMSFVTTTVSRVKGILKQD